MAIYAGTHGVANGLDALLNAAFILKQRQRNDIKLVLLGQGKLKAHLVERAQLEKLTNVVFHDPVNKLSLAGIMASADVGMQLLANIPAFYYGTSPNKFFDYISAGLPVFNNYPGWLADMVKKHGCGLVSPPDNPEAFVDALEWFADNREQLSIMGQAAHQLAESDFDRNKLAEEFVKWLESNCAPDNIKVDVC
jgi:glycosyltransferase involved in cell wall biosynthesis